MNDNKKTNEQLIKELADLREENNYLKKQFFDVVKNKGSGNDFYLQDEVLGETWNIYSDLYDLTGDVIFSISPEGKLESVNKAFENITGWEYHEWIGKYFLELAHPEDVQLAMERFSDVLKGHSAVTVELRIQKKSGDYVLTEILSSARMKNGIVISVLGIGRDLTERKLAETALKDSERRFETIFRTNPEAIAVAHFDTNELIDVNEAWQELTGYSYEEVVKRTQLNLNIWVNPEHREQIKETILKQGKFRSEMQLRRKSGEIRNLLLSSEIIELKGERYLLSMAQDITERMQAEEEIRKLNVELEQRVLERTWQLEEANKELDAFSHSISHELRAPLRYIKGFADLLLDDYREQLPEQAQNYLDTIVVSVQKMGTLIDDLLSFSRTSRVDLIKSNIKMDKIVSDALSQVKASISDRQICWNIMAFPEIYGDYVLLRQVWINLLDNAVKYTRTKENVMIELGYKDQAKEFIFYIRDNGVGFNMKYAQKLFGMFQRLHSPSKFEGSGIGLANVRRIIARHGGRTWAEAEVDKGAVFYFSIPKSDIIQ